MEDYDRSAGDDRVLGSDQGSERSEFDDDDYIMEDEDSDGIDLDVSATSRYAN